MPTFRIRDGRKTNAGFTLIELLVVLAILALAAAVVAPPLGAALGVTRLGSEHQALVSALRGARAEAVGSGRAVDFVVHDPSEWQAGERRHTLGGAVSISVDVPPAGIGDRGTRSIRFFADGRSTGGTVQLRRGTAARSVHVDWITGHVRQAP
ncbi:MAG: GspH/FimT family protein [Alphaproteobacteria bacterium]